MAIRMGRQAYSRSSGLESGPEGRFIPPIRQHPEWERLPSRRTSSATGAAPAPGAMPTPARGSDDHRRAAAGRSPTCRTNRPSDHDPGGRDGVGVLRDPPLLLRSAERDQDDRRRSGGDRAGECRIALGGMPTPPPRPRRPRRRPRSDAGKLCRHRPAARSAAPSPPPTNAIVASLSAPSPDQELADLHSRPPPHSPAGAERLDQRDAGPVGQGEVGGPQDFRVGRIVSRQ